MMMDYEILAILIAFGMIFLVFGLVMLAAMIVACWKIFEKAGEAGWKCLIPFLSGHTMYKIAWKPVWYWITLIITVVDLTMWFSGVPSLIALSWALTIATYVVSIFFYINLAKSFGKGAGFTVGLIFLPLIFLLILAFDSSKYVKAQADTTESEEDFEYEYWEPK